MVGSVHGAFKYDAYGMLLKVYQSFGLGFLHACVK